MRALCTYLGCLYLQREIKISGYDILLLSLQLDIEYIRMKFTELKLDDAVLDALEIMRFDECTPVQEHTIPPLFEGKDLIGVSQTGT